MTKSFLKQFINCKNIQTAGKYSVDSSKLKEAVDYFEKNQHLTPKVVNIKYMIDYWHEPITREHQEVFFQVKKWIWAIHGQVIVISKEKKEYFNDYFNFFI